MPLPESIRIWKPGLAPRPKLELFRSVQQKYQISNRNLNLHSF